MPMPPRFSSPSPSPYPKPTRWPPVLAWAIVIALLMGGYGIYNGAIPLAERFNPWSPLDVTAAPGVLTPFKLGRAKSDPIRCRVALAATGMIYDSLPDRVTGPGCGFENAVQLRTAGVRLSSPLPLSCPMALSFFMWERHVLQPAAQLHFGQRVAAVEHVGSYACRNINRGTGTAANTHTVSRSLHATADAMDVTALTLANGKRIAVLQQWQSSSAGHAPSKEALLLKDIHRGACRFFGAVLGPDYNAAHRDHFHLETGGYSICR